MQSDPIKHYLLLQKTRYERFLRSHGLIPSYTNIFLCLLFISASYVFFRSNYASYNYAIISLIPLFYASQKKSNEFLKHIYPKPQFAKLRLVENFVLVSGFLFFSLIKLSFINLVFISIFAYVMSFFNVKIESSKTIKTPFGKEPFEFARGFRVTLFLSLILFMFCIIGAFVGNYYLSLFTMFVSVVSCISYFTESEPMYYLWVNKNTVKEHLLQKSKMIFKHSLVVALPFLICLIIRFPEEYILTPFILLLAMVYPITAMLGKYAFYPSQLPIIPGIFLGMSLFFPPLLMAVIPYLYLKSLHNLKLVLK